MANDLSSRQWKLDTPLAFGSAGAILWKANLYVKQIEWSGYAAVNNQCILKDQTGRVVWSATGAADLSPIRLGNIGWVNGLVLDTLTAGTVVVYIQ